MSQCVPSWDVDDINPTAPRASLCSHSNSTAPDVPMLDYEVAELTWENGQISMHGLGLPRVPVKPPITATAGNPRSTASTSPSKYAWDKPRASGTLESIVNQATRLPHRSKSLFDLGNRGGCDGDDLVPWFEPRRAATADAVAAAASNTVTMDALVPCSNRTDEQITQVMDPMPATGIGTCMVGCSTRVGSCSVPAAKDEEALLARKRPRVARVPTAQEWSSRDQSVSASATFGRDDQHVTLDTCDRDLGLGYTSTSMGSPENTSSDRQCTKTTTTDDHDSVCHSRPQREAGHEEDKKKGTGICSVSTKRSRAAAIHNQSERKRRDKINQRMKILQKLVPNSSKTDKASMLDEVIDYLKQLQAQVQMMNRMNMCSMMLPMTMQQQLQMSMMAPMGMGLGMNMGMGMDMSAMSRAAGNIPGMPPVIPPATFVPMASWDPSGGDRLMQGAPVPPPAMSDPLSTFLACQSQPMTMDAYSRMAAMYQQLQQPPASNSKS